MLSCIILEEGKSSVANPECTRAHRVLHELAVCKELSEVVRAFSDLA